MVRQVKQMLAVRADAQTIAAMMDDGPAEFDVDVNDTYSKRRSLATMPPNILLTLPDLPRDIEYRFVGRHLILRDARANIIIDEIPFAFQCRYCVPKKDEEVEHSCPAVRSVRLQPDLPEPLVVCSCRCQPPATSKKEHGHGTKE